MEDFDYGRLCSFIERLFGEYSASVPEAILDLGCGTGRFCVEMSSRGYDMIGVDISTDMLSCAKTRAVREGMDVLFINQDMTALELYGTVDVAVSLVDSINHVTSPEKVKKLFRLVNNYLNPGGLFIFDINTKYKLEHIMGNNVFYSVDDDIAYIWQCSYKEPGFSESELTFFARKNNLYERFDETICERAYEDGEIRLFLNDSGLEVLDMYDEECFDKPRAHSERVFYICRKRS